MSIWNKLQNILPSKTLNSAEESWLEGWKTWRAWLASTNVDEANLYAKQAEMFFQQTLNLDPGASDAALGIHAISSERREEMLLVMIENRDRLGQYSQKFATPIFSTWKPILFAAWRMSDKTDILRAEVAGLIRQNKTHEAYAKLSLLPQDHLAEAMRISLLYNECQWEDCLIAATETALHPIFANDLRTIAGVSLRETGEKDQAGELLRKAMQRASFLAESQYINREYSLCLDYDISEEESSWEEIVDSFFAEPALDPSIPDNRG